VQKIKSASAKEAAISQKTAKVISNMVALFWNKVEKVCTHFLDFAALTFCQQVLALQSQAEDAHLRKLQLDSQLGNNLLSPKSGSR